LWETRPQLFTQRKGRPAGQQRKQIWVALCRSTVVPLSLEGADVAERVHVMLANPRLTGLESHH